MFTDEARINMTPRNTNDLAFPIPPNQHDFVEMVWENNSLVMKQQYHQEKSNTRRPVFSSGFSDFFRFETENVNNPRAVPDETTDNYIGLAAANTINYDFSSKKQPSCSYINNSNKRSGDDTIQIVENKKLKATVVDQLIITPTPPPTQGDDDDSLVPVHELKMPAAVSMVMKRRKMIETNDHLVPGPDMSIAASNDIAPCTTSQLIYQHSHSSSSYLAETQQWSDEDEESARRSRRKNYNRRRNRSSSLIHTRSEKKRRDRINKKMRALQVLLPNTNKVVDKASVLDDAIEYVKSLQLQLQLMSSGTHMFAASPMMMPQIPMNQFSAAAAAAMGLGMAPHQFPMHGFPQMSCFPYMPFFGAGQSPSAMAVPVVQPETTSVDQIGSNPPPMSGSNHSSYPNDFSQMGFESELRNK